MHLDFAIYIDAIVIILLSVSGKTGRFKHQEAIGKLMSEPTAKQLEFCFDLLERHDNAIKDSDGKFPFEQSRGKASAFIRKSKQISWAKEHDEWLAILNDY